MFVCSEEQSTRVGELGARVPLFTLNGSSHGPRLVVIGDEDLLREVADLAWHLPHLVNISGSMILRSSQSNLGLDRARFVMHLGPDDTDPEAVLARILRRVSRRGMIPTEIRKAA